MASITTYIKELANTQLFFVKANIDKLPGVLMWINLISYCSLYKITYDYFFNHIPVHMASFPKWYYYIESNVRHIFECSGLTLLLLSAYMRRCKMPLITLWCLFLVNTAYLLAGWDIDIYFCVTVCLIYFIFVTLAARKLTNR